MPIHVETGRHYGKPRDERTGLICNNGEVEDEIHVLFKCKAYRPVRTILFDQAASLDAGFNEFTEIDKLSFMLTQENMLRKMAHYLKEVLSIRQNQLTM